MSGVGANDFFLVNADLLLVTLRLITNDAILKGEERIISTDADVVTGVDLRAALAHEDATRKNLLAILTLHAKALRVGISAVVGGTGTLFMSD